MNVNPLSEIEIQEKSDLIVSDLVSIPVVDALKILTKVQTTIVNENLGREIRPEQLVYSYNPLLNRRGPIMKVEADPEVKAFIHSLKMYHPIMEIVNLCIRKFGSKRAPSKSSLGRYLQRLKIPNNKVKEQ